MHSQFYRCFDPAGGGGRDARFRLLLSSLLLCSDPTLSILQNGSIPPSIFSIVLARGSWKATGLSIVAREANSSRPVGVEGKCQGEGVAYRRR